MALTGHFLDFREEVYRLRNNMYAEIYSMMFEKSITCTKGDFSLNMGDELGNQEVTSISHSPEDMVFVITAMDEQYDVTELLTDDIVALYEFIFNHFYPDQS